MNPLKQIKINYNFQSKKKKEKHNKLEWALGRAHTFAFHKIGH